MPAGGKVYESTIRVSFVEPNLPWTMSLKRHYKMKIYPAKSGLARVKSGRVDWWDAGFVQPCCRY